MWTDRRRAAAVVAAASLAVPVIRWLSKRLGSDDPAPPSRTRAPSESPKSQPSLPAADRAQTQERQPQPELDRVAEPSPDAEPLSPEREPPSEETVCQERSPADKPSAEAEAPADMLSPHAQGSVVMAPPERGPAEVRPFASDLQRLSAEAVEEVLQRVDEGSSGRGAFESIGEEDGVQLSSLVLPGAKLPLLLAVRDRSAGSSPPLDSLAAVMLSHHCRKFFDPLYERNVMLQMCGPDVALLCCHQRSTPVSSPSFWVNVAAVRRTTGAASRLTLVMAGAPAPVVEHFQERIDRSSTEKRRQGTMRLWALDALQREDGSMRLAFVLHTDANTLMLPGFVVKKILSTAAAAMVGLVWKMSQFEMVPKSFVSFFEQDTDDPTGGVCREIAGQTVGISKMLLGAFPLA